MKKVVYPSFCHTIMASIDGGQELINKAADYAMEDHTYFEDKSRNEQLDEIYYAISSNCKNLDAASIVDMLRTMLINRIRRSLSNEFEEDLRIKVDKYEKGERGVYLGPEIKEVSLGNTGGHGDALLVVLWAGKRANRDYYELYPGHKKFSKIDRYTMVHVYGDRKCIWGSTHLD